MGICMKFRFLDVAHLIIAIHYAYDGLLLMFTIMCQTATPCCPREFNCSLNHGEQQCSTASPATRPNQSAQAMDGRGGSCYTSECDQGKMQVPQLQGADVGF